MLVWACVTFHDYLWFFNCQPCYLIYLISVINTIWCKINMGEALKDSSRAAVFDIAVNILRSQLHIYNYYNNTRLAILNLEPLELRRLKNDILMYYKILYNLTPISPDDHFTKRPDTSIHTRTSGTGLLLKPFCRTTRIGNHFYFRSIEAWNTLPSTITNASSPLMSKRLLSTWDLSSFLVGKLY